MSDTRGAPREARSAFVAGVVLAVLATLIDNGVIAWIVAPIVIGLFVYAAAKSPISSSLLAMTFFALTLENPRELPAAGSWYSPLYPLGALVQIHMNRQAKNDLLFFSGMDIMIGVLIVLAIHRRRSRSSLDGRPTLLSPKPLGQLAWLALGGMVFSMVSGLLRNGETGIALTQIDRVFYLPVLFLLFQVGMRGMNDYVALAKTVVLAAVMRACQVVYVQTFIPKVNPETGLKEPIAYGTTHNDSMLFAWVTVLLIAGLIIKVQGMKKMSLLALPILIWGMLENQRRMVWMQIILVFILLYYAMPPNRIERKIRKWLIYLSPVGLLYVVIGWSQKAAFFKPVQTIRSAVDSDVDASTQWRDIENYNLVYTIKQNPIFGSGYGHGFIEAVPLPKVDYMLELYVPHNSVLGLWAYCGYIGYTAMTLLWVAGVYFAIRAYRFANTALEKCAALVALAAVPIYYVQCYGDLGLGSWTGVYMVSASIAIAGQLAVTVGAWPAQAPARGPSRMPLRASAPAPAPEPPRARY
jgi:hypothetical protein